MDHILYRGMFLERGVIFIVLEHDFEIQKGFKSQCVWKFISKLSKEGNPLYNTDHFCTPTSISILKPILS